MRVDILDVGHFVWVDENNKVDANADDGGDANENYCNENKGSDDCSTEVDDKRVSCIDKNTEIVA